MALNRVNIPYVSDQNPEKALSELEKICNGLASDYRNEELIFADVKVVSYDDLRSGIRFTAFTTIIAPNVEPTKPKKSPFD